MGKDMKDLFNRENDKIICASSKDEAQNQLNCIKVLAKEYFEDGYINEQDKEIIISNADKWFEAMWNNAIVYDGNKIIKVGEVFNAYHKLLGNIKYKYIGIYPDGCGNDVKLLNMNDGTITMVERTWIDTRVITK